MGRRARESRSGRPTSFRGKRPSLRPRSRDAAQALDGSAMFVARFTSGHRPPGWCIRCCPGSRSGHRDRGIMASSGCRRDARGKRRSAPAQMASTTSFQLRLPRLTDRLRLRKRDGNRREAAAAGDRRCSTGLRPERQVALHHLAHASPLRAGSRREDLRDVGQVAHELHELGRSRARNAAQRARGTRGARVPSSSRARRISAHGVVSSMLERRITPAAPSSAA